MCEGAEFGEGEREGGGFGAAGIGAQGKDDGQFVEDDGGIFDEHGIGESGFGGERDDFGAELFEELFVGVMLFAGFGEVDGAAVEEGEFAIDDGGADGAGDGGEHGERKSVRDCGGGLKAGDWESRVAARFFGVVKLSGCAIVL